MNKNLPIILISGVLMTGFLSNLFGMSGGAEVNQELKQREIIFTGSKLLFSMPENFSADFPAENLIDQVDLSDASLFKQSNKAILLRRWWDFSEPSFISSREIGTIMLSIYVNKSNKEFIDRIGLISSIHSDLDSQFKESNKTTQAEFQIAYPETFESFNEKIINNQRWLSYTVAPMNALEATLSYVSPLSKNSYVELAFTLMPSSKINTREFEDKYSREFIDRIMGSVSLKYEDSTTQSDLGVDTKAIELNELILINNKSK